MLVTLLLLQQQPLPLFVSISLLLSLLLQLIADLLSRCTIHTIW